MSLLQLDIAFSVLSKPPAERTGQSIDSVVQWLRGLKLFKQLDEAIVRDVALNCDIETYDTDHVLIRQGERGDCFYIILQGSVAIYVLTDLQEGAIAGKLKDHQQRQQREQDQENNATNAETTTTPPPPMSPTNKQAGGGGSPRS